MLVRLIKEVPGHWVGLHDQDDEHLTVAKSVPGLDVRLNVSFDEFVALAAAARLTIGPDSFLTHLRGAMGKRGVAVFGTHDPKLRTRYYPEIVPIWERKACPSSPCHVYRNVFPRYLCPPVTPPRQECAVVGAGYDTVVDTVKKLWPVAII